MIRLQNLTKTYRLDGVTKTIIKQANLVIPAKTSVGLLGRNGAGKSTLLRLIAGTQVPTSGKIIIEGTVSWPVGFAGSFHADLTGAQNTRYIARIYGIDSDELVRFAEDFAELGPHFNLPLRSYSSGMTSRLAFAVSMGIAFDFYLVDEITAVGDSAFRKKSNDLFLARMSSAGAIVVNHTMSVIRSLCSKAIVLDDGELYWFDDVDEAIRFHNELMLG